MGSKRVLTVGHVDPLKRAVVSRIYVVVLVFNIRLPRYSVVEYSYLLVAHLSWPFFPQLKCVIEETFGNQPAGNCWIFVVHSIPVQVELLVLKQMLDLQYWVTAA